MVTRLTLPNGKPAFDMSFPVSAARTSRDRGPMTESTALEEVTSVRRASSPSGIEREIQSKSCVAKPVPVTMYYSVGDSLPTVRSHSMPPRLFSIWV